MFDSVKNYVKRVKEGALKELIREMKWICQYAKRYWKAMVFYTLLGLSGTVISLVSSLISRDMVDIVTGQKTGMLVQTFSLYIGFSIGNLIVSQISSYFSNKISIRVDNEIKADIFDKMLVADMETMQKYHTGDLLARWNTDASVISNGVLSFLPNILIYVVRFISTLALVVYYDPIFALLALIGLPVSALMSKTVLKRMKNYNKKSAAMNAKMSGFSQEAFSNIQTIKGFDLIRLYGERLRQLQSEYLSMKLNYQKLSMVTSFILSVVGLLVSYSCYGFGIYRVWSGAITYGTMTMFLSLAGSLTGTMNNLTSLVPTAINMGTSAGRLMEILEMPKEDYHDAEKAEAFLENNREYGMHLTLNGMSYTYHTGTEVFCKADFEAHPHEVVAIVGPSGEGKTTLLRVLLALLHPQEGENFIYSRSADNGMEISPSTRRFFSYVPQGNTMFSGTIADNMRNVKKNATDEEIIETLRMACAWEFVEKLPDGINSQIGERGAGFSEGQAQRLSIARALLRRSPILLLDEATSALDIETEERVLHNIMQDDYPRTCIVTTHRPSVLDICKRVYRIKDKRCEVIAENDLIADDGKTKA